MNGFDALGRRLPTAEEQAEFEAALEAAKAKFRAAALAEPNEVGAGWRPWMGPRREPTPEEVAAHEAAWAEWRARVREKALAGDYDEPPVLGAPRWAIPLPAAPVAPAANGHPAAPEVSPSPSAPA